jgi:hypothetical protein
MAIRCNRPLFFIFSHSNTRNTRKQTKIKTNENDFYTMKKKITFLGAAFVLLAFLAIPLGMRGENVTIQYTGTTTTNMTGQNDAATVGLDAQHWSVVGDKGSNSNFPGLNKDGSIRLYWHTNGSNTITVTNSDDYTISSIAVTYKSNTNNNGTITVNGNQVAGTGTDTQKTYEINASSFVIGNGNTSNVQVHITKIVITYTTGSAPVVATPIITPDGGGFLDSQEISIACATEGAIIHYTIDGTTPTASSPTYSAPFTINATTTVKAIGVKANYDNSEVATAVFTKKTPMTVAEARTFIDGLNGTTSDFEFVTGIISAIDSYNSNFHSITYWISDDGTTTDQLEAYGGISGIDNWTFNSIDDIHVGATVTIYGKLKKYIDNSNNEIYEFDLNNQLISYTTPAITVATPTFSPAAGTYTEIQTVTISCENQGADIFYTIDGSTPNDESIPYSTPIEVSETTTIKAIAYYEDYASAVATAQYVINLPYTGPAYARVDNVSYLTDGVKVILAARFDTIATNYYAMSNTTTGKPVGVLFTSTTSGDFEVLPADILDSENSYCWTVGVTENGYTFTNANGQVIGYTSSTNFATGGDNTEWTIARGTSDTAAMVPSYKAFTITNHNIVARGFALNSQHNFGPYAVSNYNSQDAGNYNFYFDIFVQGAEPVATPFINAADEVEIAYDATSGTIEYEIENPVTGTALTASTDASWISGFTYGDNAVTFTTTINEGEEDRTATITLTYGVVTKEVTVIQGHFVIDYAVLPFEWEGGLPDTFDALTGTTLYGVGSYPNQTTYQMKLDGDGDYIMVKTDSQPGKVTIGVKMVGGSDTSTITVQGSTDGEIFTDIQALTISGNQNDELTLETTNAFNENDRYVKMVFTKGSNVGVGPITIAKPSTDPVIAVTPATVELDANQYTFANETVFTITYQNIEITNYQSFGIQFYDANDENIETPQWLVIGVAGTNDEGYKVSGVVSANTSEARSAYFRVYSGDVYSNLVTINQAAAPQQYTLTVEPFENLELITFVNYEMLMEGDSTIYVTEGDSIMLSVVALEGYIMKTLMVNNVNHVNDIADDFTYTFVMPAENVTISATAVELVAPDNYVRITSLDQLTDGCKVIIAARYDEEHTNGYFAMPGVASGKPTGVAFTSETSGNDEILPATIAQFEDTYYWTVNITEDGYTFTNAEGQKIGYSSSTNFAINGNNTEWTIEQGTADVTAMVSEYTGFVITNKNNTGRAFAFNGSVFGAYAKTNIAAAGYNFFLDFFVQMETTQTTTQTIVIPNTGNASFWFSTYIEMDPVDLLEAIETQLGENGIEIKYKNITTAWDGEEEEWTGDLQNAGLTNDKTYMIKTNAAVTVTLEGPASDPADYQITLAPKAWTWIGFPCGVEVDIENAFANFVPVDGDQIKAKGATAAWDDGEEEWSSTDMTKLVPGTGYMFYSNGTTTRTLTFSTGSAKHSNTEK